MKCLIWRGCKTVELRLLLDLDSMGIESGVLVCGRSGQRIAERREDFVVGPQNFLGFVLT